VTPHFRGLYKDGLNALLTGPSYGGANFEIGSFRNNQDDVWSVQYPHPKGAKTCPGLSLYAITNRSYKLEEEAQKKDQSQESMRDFVKQQNEHELEQLFLQLTDTDRKVETISSEIKRKTELKEQHMQSRISHRLKKSDIEMALESFSESFSDSALSNIFKISEIDATQCLSEMNSIRQGTNDARKKELAKFILDHSINNADWIIINEEIALDEIRLAKELDRKEALEALKLSHISKMDSFLTRFPDQ
jgi:hypothetical protein